MRFPARQLDSIAGDVAARDITREEPRLGLFETPPVTEDFQQPGGEHDVAILCAGNGYVPGITAIYKRRRLPRSAARVASSAQLHITMVVLLG